MLEYDNNAFYYFAITLLCIYLIPSIYYTFNELKAAFIGGETKETIARTKVEQEKSNFLKVRTGKQRLTKWTFILNLIVLLLALTSCLYLVNKVRHDGEVRAFDPYKILGLEHEATESEIKKAYRKLSLKYHPDKNLNNEHAADMFVLVSKAHTALTDPVSRENFLKFGNPDGKQALEVSIGLPKILLENQKTVMVIYLIAIVVVIPIAVGLWYANSKQYGEKNIMYETYSMFYQLLSENHHVKMMPEVFAASAECRNIYDPASTNREDVGKLFYKMKNEYQMHKPRFEVPAILQANLLLHVHMLRLSNTLSPELRRHMNEMLVIAPELIDGMIEISYQRKWLATTIAAIKFSQCVKQALWVNDHPLMQLPHFTAEEVKHATRNSKAQTSKAMSEYLRVADEEKKGISKMSEEDKSDVLTACRIIPTLKIEGRLFVEDEDEENGAAEKNDDIFEGDLMTLRITITRENVPEGESAPVVHAPHFPRTLRENFWVILTDKLKPDPKRGNEMNATLYTVEKITNQSRVVVHDLKCGAPPKAGEYILEAHIYSDCYLGLDETIPLKFTVRPASEIPVFEAHPEDKEIANEPTLFEQMLASNADDDSSSDEEDEDEKDKSKKITPSKKNEALIEELDGDSEDEN